MEDGEARHGEQEQGRDPLAVLDGVEDLSLEEQVAVFEAVHADLSRRLSVAEG